MSPFSFWLCIGLQLVFLQFLASLFDGYATRAQMKKKKAKGYAFTEHGGMMADILIVSPVVAFIMSAYRFDYLGRFSIIAAAVSVVCVFFILRAYRAWGKEMPEAHAHSGRVTEAGWIHAVYAAWAIWAVIMFYFGEADRPITKTEVAIVTLAFMPWCVLGQVKFSPHWRLKKSDIAAMTGLACAFLVVGAIRFLSIS